MQCSNVDVTGNLNQKPCGGAMCIPAAQFDHSYAADPPIEGEPPTECPTGQCENECGCRQCEAAAGR